MESPLTLDELGVSAGAPQPTNPSNAHATDGLGTSDATSASTPHSHEARVIDDSIKSSLRANITNHELACVVVDIVSPGYAIQRLGGLNLENLTPTQHLVVACLAITGVVLVTNPELAKKLKHSIMPSPEEKEAKQQEKQRKETMQQTKQQQQAAQSRVNTSPEGRAIDAVGNPMQTYLDMTGEVL